LIGAVEIFNHELVSVRTVELGVAEFLPSGAMAVVVELGGDEAFEIDALAAGSDDEAAVGGDGAGRGGDGVFVLESEAVYAAEERAGAREVDAELGAASDGDDKIVEVAGGGELKGGVVGIDAGKSAVGVDRGEVVGW